MSALKIASTGKLRTSWLETSNLRTLMSSLKKLDMRLNTYKIIIQSINNSKVLDTELVKLRAEMRMKTSRLESIRKELANEISNRMSKIIKKKYDGTEKT